MAFNRNQHILVGTVSGLLAAYWVAFSIYWTRAYLKARSQGLSLTLINEHRVPTPSVPFHLGILLFQLITIVFFASHSAYLLRSDNSEPLQDFCWLMFSLDLSAAYLVGMSFSLGFGTLYAKIPRKESLTLMMTTALILTVCISEFSGNDTVDWIFVGVPVCVFVLQLILMLRTISIMSQRISWSNSQGYQTYSISMQQYRRNMRLVFFLICELFLIASACMIVAFLDAWEKVTTALWLLYVLSGMVVNSCVMVMMKPDAKFMEVQNIQDEFLVN